MALREDQIQRYSRQILLREVGGRGQARLLEAVIVVEGQSDALDVAVAYLAASGTPLREARPTARAGFLEGATLGDFSVDAVARPEAPVRGWLGPLTQGPGAPTTCFRVGVASGLVVGVPAHAPWPTEAGAVVEAEPVTVGALAALVVQRFVLGLEAGLVTVRAADGQWQRS